jgi:hypothetical protein
MATGPCAGNVNVMSQPVVVAVSEPAEARDAITLGAGIARLLQAPLVLAGVAVCPGAHCPVLVVPHGAAIPTAA